MTDLRTEAVGSRVTRLIRSAVAELLRATSRFPVTTVLVVLFGLVSNAIRLDVMDLDDTSTRLLAVLSGGAAASLAGHLVGEGRLANAALRALAAFGLAAAIGAALWIAEPFELYSPIVLAMALGAVPLLGMAGRGSPADYWGFVLWLSAGVILAFLSVLVFSLGVYAILQMLNDLLDVPRYLRVESAIWVTALTLVGPLVALSRVPPTGGSGVAFDPNERFVRTVRPLADWVLAPLVLAAAAVIHLYAARIGITGEVPKGQIGWIVSSYLLAILALRIAIDPFAGDEGPPARIVRRFWGWLVVVPLVLAVYALWLRIAGEGVTVSRYFVGLWLCVGLVAVAAQLPPRWRGDIRVLSAIPLALLALSLFGPWGVAATVTRSQLFRIDRDYGAILRDPTSAASPTNVGPLSLFSRLQALKSVGSLERIAEILTEPKRSDPIWTRRELTVQDALVSLNLPSQAETAASPRYFDGRSDEPVDLAGFDRGAFSVATELGHPGASFAVRLAPADRRLHLRIGRIEDEAVIDALVARLPWAEAGPGPANADPAVFDLTTAGGRMFRIRVEAATLGPGDRIQRLVATYLWRDAEWRSPTPPQ